MDFLLSFMSQFVLSFLCLSAQTNAISGSEANVMSNKLLSHIDQVHDIGDPMNIYCNLNPQSVEDTIYLLLAIPNMRDEIVTEEELDSHPG